MSDFAIGNYAQRTVTSRVRAYKAVSKYR